VIGSLAEAEEHFADLAGEMRRLGHATVVLLPLTTGPAGDSGTPEVRGVLTFGFAGPRELTDSELRVVRLLGQQAGQALDRAALYDQARRREDRATFLVETTRALDEAHRLIARAHRLVERMVPEIADWAAVRLQIGPGGLLADAGGPEPDPELLAGWVAAVTSSGEPWFAPPEAPDGGCVVLPLTSRGRVLGTLALRLREPARGAADVTFLIDLADRAGLALENARLYEQERAIARTLQRSLLADHMPRDKRFVVETHYQAAAQDLEVGGDWFDAFMISPDKLAVVVGDVVGRGIDAATTMGQLRSAIRALATTKDGPATLLEHLDRFVERVESARMATVAYAEVNLGTGVMTYACAGHLPPLLQEPAAAPRFLLDGRSGPLGSRAGKRERTEQQVQLSAGSRLLLYTDGLVERRNRTIDRGLDVLVREWGRRQAAPMPGITAAIADTLVGKDHADDVCLLCLTIGTEERLERSIGADPMQIALLRQDLRGWLTTHAVDEEVTQAVLLACSEAVANAIEHGYRDDPFGQVEVIATVSPDAVEVRVTDHGVWRPEPSDGSRGRGLRLIRQAMDHVAIDHTDSTAVTMRRSRPR
jgi:serine/threonine-protein kinase RsbW